MEIVGRIVPATESKPFERESWIRIIQEHPDLIPPQARSGIPNPFVPGETMTVYPDPTYASLVVNGTEVATFDWGNNDETMINVHGTLHGVTSVANDIAARLGGRFVPE